MESSSSGRFHHYQGPPVPQGSGGGEQKTGGKGEIDPCDAPLPNVRLEEVGRSEFISNKKTVPATNTSVQVRRTLTGGRIAVETTRGNLSIGFLPTACNYLLSCLKAGRKSECSKNSFWFHIQAQSCAFHDSGDANSWWRAGLAADEGEFQCFLSADTHFPRSFRF